MQTKIIIKLVKIKIWIYYVVKNVRTSLLTHYWWKYKLIKPLEREIWHTDQNLQCSAIPLQGIYPIGTVTYAMWHMYRNMSITVKD